MGDPLEAPAWLGEHDRELSEHVEPPAAWALSFLFGGGGQLLVHDRRKGVALVLIDVLAVALLPAQQAVWAWLAIGTLSSILAVRQALALNRYTSARILARQGGQLALVSAGAEPAMPVLGERADRLRKLADLRRAGVLSDVDHRERKVEILSSLGDLLLSHHEDVLHELVRLRARGIVDDADVQFVKDLGA